MEYPCDLNDVMRAIGTLEGAMKEGFDGIHRRQDVTNGRLDKHEVRLTSLELSRSEQKGEKRAFNWIGSLIAGSMGLIAGLVGSLMQSGKL